jgi:hypothetical protein
MTDKTPPSWVQLLILMVDGPDPEPTVRGVIRSDDGNDDNRRHVGWATMAGQPIPVFAGTRAALADSDGGHPDVGEDTPLPPLRVWRDGRRIRIEELDGTPSLIVGEEHCWQFDADDDTPLKSPASAVRYQLSATELLTRRDANDFAGDDFTRPTGPIGASSFLGRPAWTVELAPPQHKPYPMQLVVDAETGLVLQQRNDGFGSVSEWTEVTVGEPMNDDLFSWDGATRSPVDDHALVIAEHEADGRRRSAWFATHVTALPLRVELSVGVWVHEFDEESGAFQASLGEHQFGMIARRPAGTVGEWELGWDGRGRRWTDGRWQWAVSVYQDALSDEGFAALRAQLEVGPATQV